MVAIRPVSDAFLRTITGSHSIAVRAVVLDSYQEGVSPAGTGIGIEDGDVTYDATAQVVGTLDLTTDGNGFDPRPGRHLLQPYGNEIWLARGVQVGGSVEYVSLGYYMITDVEQDQAPNGPLRISGSDRMQKIIDAQLISPVSFAASNSVADVFETLVLPIYPSLTIDYDWDATSDLLGSAQVTDNDRYQFLADLCTTRGKIMYFDYQGHLAIKSPPGPSAPVIQVPGGEDGVLVSAARTLSRDGVANAMVVQADGADDSAAPLAIAYDSDPASPTYYYGPYGRVPQFWSNPLVTTTAQAQAAASLMLAKAIRLPLTADWSAVPNPALEPWDVVRLAYPGGDGATLIIDTLTIPLTAAEALSGTAHNPASIAAATTGGLI